MSSLSISCIVFAIILGGMLLGMILRARLPEAHLSSESKDLIKLGMGLIGTMTALVLGLLIASAKGSFDTQRHGLAQLSANVIVLDRMLAQYGKEAKVARETLRSSVVDLIQRTWPAENSQPEQTGATSGTEGRYEVMYDRLRELAPKTEVQRNLKAQALKTALDIGQTRWLMFAEKGSSIPTVFLVVLICWLALILASFSLFAPPNATVFITLLVCAVVVSSGIFLILELDQPFKGGMIQVPSAPLRNALEHLGR
jgi:hypothetical protein